MSKRLLRARPIAEGIASVGGHRKVIWRDYLWNTGTPFRWWFMDPEEAAELQISVVDIVERRDNQDEIPRQSG